MEMDDKTEVSKRGRDNEDEEDDEKSESSSLSTLTHKSKKQEFLAIDWIEDEKEDTDDDSYRYREGIGVFDFPWLKESSVVFQVKDYLDVELDMFAACLDDVDPDVDLGPKGSMWELGFDDNEEGLLWSSCKIEDLEPFELVWRCVCTDGKDNYEFHRQPVKN